MFEFCGYCSSELVEGICPECGADFNGMASDLRRTIVLAVVGRHNACTELISAAADAIKYASEENPVVTGDIIDGTTQLIIENSLDNEQLLGALELIEEECDGCCGCCCGCFTEECECCGFCGCCDCCTEECDGCCDECECECCECRGCPYLDICNGDDYCLLEEDDDDRCLPGEDGFEFENELQDHGDFYVVVKIGK